MANESLRRNPTSTGNRKVWTWSGWVKRSSLGGIQHIFSVGSTLVAPWNLIYFENEKINWYVLGPGNVPNIVLTTSAVYRDISSWFHIMYVMDTTQTNSSDRQKIYVNGILQALTGTYIATQNFDGAVNNPSLSHYIGRQGNDSGPDYCKAEITDVFFIDGQALTPDVFGFYKAGKGYISVGSTQATDFRPGQWVPKTPRVIKTEINRRGGFGVNGFYLPMNDSNNFGADFHGEPNSIITLNEKLPQPRVGVATTASVGLGYTDALRADPYAANLVLAIPGISTSTAPNLITNGTFDTSTTGWTAVQATISAVNGNLRIVPNSGVNGGVYQSITTEVGKRYTVFMEVTAAGASFARLHVGTSTNIDSADKYTYTNSTSIQNVGVGRYTISFTPITTTTIIWLEVGGGAQTQIDFDNVIVRQEDAPKDYSAFIKGSGTNKSITASGNAGIGYNIPSYYGSALTFDGSGDYMEVIDNGDFSASGDFTVEFWGNLNSLASAQYFFAKWNSGANQREYLIEIATNGTVNFNWSTNGNTHGSVSSRSGLVSINQWNHYVWEKRNSTLSGYVNGVVVGIKTDLTSQYNNTSNPLYIGSLNSSTSSNVYIQDLRIYKGVAKYTGGFDVPRPYTPVGIATWRAVPDCTANNFATLNSLRLSSNGTTLNGRTLTNGNLTVTNTSINQGSSASISVSSGQWYWEFRLDTFQSDNIWMGILDENFGGGNSTPQPVDSNQWPSNGNDELILYGSSGSVYRGSVNTTSSLGTIRGGDILGVALDLSTSNTAPTVSFYKNGVLQHTSTGSITTVATPSGVWRPAITFGGGATGWLVSANFGQNPTFSGNTTAGTFTDSNGKGLFKYQPPSGFLALCEDNLPTPAISDPGKYFKTVLYTGDGNAGRSIVGIGFTPDLVWLKARSNAYSHKLYDSVRGFPLQVDSNSTGAEVSGHLNSANIDGFSLGSDAGVNGSGSTFVAWCWRAGAGTTSTNTNGSITSVVSVNQDAGFSIVSWTGTGASGATVGHGLGKKPAFIIQKARGDGTYGWNSWHKGLGTDYYISLNSTGAQDNSVNIFPSAGITSSVFQTATSAIKYNNLSGVGHIAYCWAEIEGFSKFGSYVGNGSSDGPFVYCGFKPAWLLIKSTGAGGDSWYMTDSSRNSVNGVSPFLTLRAESSNAESSGPGDPIDLLSNGFKMRGSGTAVNGSGTTYIFAAFAESPFTTANAK